MYCNIEKEEMRVKRIEKVDKNCRRNKMFPVYEQKKENVHILQKTSRHAPPHLHNSVEFIYVISGSRGSTNGRSKNLLLVLFYY